jgi:hypothetical protein
MDKLTLNNGVTIEFLGSRIIVESTDGYYTEIRFLSLGEQGKTFMERKQTLLQLTKIYDEDNQQEAVLSGALLK